LVLNVIILQNMIIRFFSKLIFVNIVLIGFPWIGLSQAITLKSNLIHLPNKSVQTQNTYSGLHGFYKRYVSSQDGSSCQFAPSCSHYAKLAIIKHHLFLGIILTTDRLIRCNGHFEDHFFNAQGKAIDLP